MSRPPSSQAPRPARLALATALGLGLAATASPVLAAEGASSSHPVRPAAVDIPHVEGEAKIDGVMDEAFWSKATKVDLGIETRPAENTPAEVKTTAYIAEDGKNVLIAFVAEDPNPKQIRAFLRDRDAAYNDDFVGVVLDTFDDERRGYEFFVNPLGAQMDLVIDDTTGNEDDSWDGIWDSAGKITGTGYVTKLETPLSTFSIQRGLAAASRVPPTRKYAGRHPPGVTCVEAPGLGAGAAEVRLARRERGVRGLLVSHGAGRDQCRPRAAKREPRGA